VFENPLDRKSISVKSDGLGNLWGLGSEKRTEAGMKRGANVILEFYVGRTGFAEAGQGELGAEEDASLGSMSVPSRSRRTFKAMRCFCHPMSC
jgi:hypothetical protein